MPVQFTVRGSDGLRTWALDEWQTLTAVASISAEPESILEFLTAIRRFQPNDDWSKNDITISDLQEAPSLDGQWCFLDLTARAIISGPHLELPEPGAAMQADGDENGQASNVVWLDPPADWLSETATADWHQTVDRRASRIAEEDRPDGRAVLYGADMLQMMADRVLIAAASGLPESRRLEFNRGVHADWLMTPRDDLAKTTPREWMLHNREHIDCDLQHRSEQWAMQGFAVPPLDVSSAAYQHARFGTTEIVLYFDLFRRLLTECWQQSDAGIIHHNPLVEHLTTSLQSFWKDSPDDSPHSNGGRLSRQQMIECERRRMPITGDQTHLDCDCPICQIATDESLGHGPMFLMTDAHELELEDEFAFSITLSRTDWDRERSGPPPAVPSAPAKPTEDSASVWQSSFVDWDQVMNDPAPALPPVAVLGFPLAELITSLKQHHASQPQIDSLNLAFTEFRSAQNLTAAQTAATEFQQCLEHVATDFPDLTSQSADLQSRIDEIVRKQRQRIAEATHAKPQPALTTTIPILNVVVFRTPGPADAEVAAFSEDHANSVSPRPPGGGLGYLTLEADDFDRVAAGISSGDNVGTAAAVLHFLGPNAADLIQQPQDLDYIWFSTDNTPFERILMLQVVMRPHLLE